MGQGWNRENVRDFAEVFTPAFMVFQMILVPDVRDMLTNAAQKMFEGCCGQGQFAVSVLVWKLFYNLGELDEEKVLEALDALYGIDIQQESIDECRVHMLAAVCSAYEFFTGQKFSRTAEAAAMIEKYFVQGDLSLTDEKSKKRKRDDVQLSLF